MIFHLRFKIINLNSVTGLARHFNKLRLEFVGDKATAVVACDTIPSDPLTKAGLRRDDLPDYRYDEIAKHKTMDDHVWVMFRNGVYDITNFMVGHPGGDKILLAAGASIEPFWELYAIHKNENIVKMLEELRIGNIHPDDLAHAENNIAKADDHYAHEPKRHPALHVHVAKPFNAETPNQLIIDNFVTPNELFFVRNHLPVPDVRSLPKPAVVEISGNGMRRPVLLTIDQLKKKFKVHTITMIMQCAGNRRSDMSAYKPARGLQWASGAVGNAEWTGVKLSDVLAYAGIKEGDEVKHILFQGMDKDD